jgi:hypothetical protein
VNGGVYQVSLKRAGTVNDAGIGVSLSSTAITTKFCHQRRTRSQPNIRSRQFYSFAR